MALVIRGRGNRYANLEDVYGHEEAVHREQSAVRWQHVEEQFVAMRDQVEGLITLLSNMCGHNEHCHQPPPQILEEEDE
jgi:hypothetical protein